MPHAPSDVFTIICFHAKRVCEKYLTISLGFVLNDTVFLIVLRLRIEELEESRFGSKFARGGFSAAGATWLCKSFKIQKNSKSKMAKRNSKSRKKAIDKSTKSILHLARPWASTRMSYKSCKYVHFSFTKATAVP